MTEKRADAATELAFEIDDATAEFIGQRHGGDVTVMLEFQPMAGG